MLVCGQPPFQEANDSETLTMIMDCKYTVPAHVSSACKDLIDRMLQRDPKQRASLDEIETHTWLQGVDPSPATKYNTPLVSHKNLSEEEHNSIIQRMVLGDIADREAIVEALETNKYNHITATYYLLAERILREKQEKEVQTRSSSPSNIKAQFRQSWPTRVDMHQDIEDSLAASSISHAGGPQSPARSAENLLNGHRSKGLMELGRREETVTDSLGLPAQQRTCLFRVEEDEEEEEEQDPSPLPTQVILRRKPPSVTNRLTSRKSAPVLNQIFEEGESDDDFDMDEGLPPKLSRLKMNMAGNKRYHRRKSQGRGSSCSSSETSDDDSESHRRRLDKDSGFGYGWNRRDSSEGPPGSSGGNGGGSSSGQGKPPGEGGGQDSPSSCCNNSSTTNPTLSTLSRSARSASRSTELVESLKLMSLCLSSQLQHHRGEGKLIIDPRSLSGGSVKIQEKSAWRMCISSSASLDTITLPTTAALPRTHSAQHHHRKTAPHNPPGLRSGPGDRNAHSNLSTLKNGMLQLPLCEKTISVNIQRGGGSRDGLLCTSAPASCCQVI
uniref:non-specific serine/threonine protein kinase n=1 Tax=Seriola lalandi dorsalis TaxID=1841481 RepID=A0A3B4Z265_SERLL